MSDGSRCDSSVETVSRRRELAEERILQRHAQTGVLRGGVSGLCCRPRSFISPGVLPNSVSWFVIEQRATVLVVCAGFDQRGIFEVILEYETSCAGSLRPTRGKKNIDWLKWDYVRSPRAD